MMGDNSSIYAIYGKSGFGREVIPLVANQFASDPRALTIFLDDEKVEQQVNGYEVWTFEEFIAHSAPNKYVVIAIADGTVRQRLVRKCSTSKVEFISILAENHVKLDNCVVGEGAIFCPYTTLTSDIFIGNHFHCNIYSYVAHDCVIGDYVTFAPGVKCNGNVRIEDHAYIGTGAILKQGTPEKPLVIGAGATVGMGAVVTKDVAPGATVIGNPARPLVK